MKKRFALLLLLFFLVPTQAQAVTIYEHAEKLPITVHMDGYYVPYDVNPIIQSGRVLLPLRAAAETLDTKVDWKSDTREAIITTKDGRRIVFTMNANHFTMDGTPHALDVPMAIVEGRTLIPLRAFAEALNAKVDWDGKSRDVSIVSGTQAMAATPPDTGIPEIQWLFNKFYLHQDHLDGVNGNWVYVEPGNDDWTEWAFIAPLDAHRHQLIYLQHNDTSEIPAATILVEMRGEREGAHLTFGQEKTIYFKGPGMGMTPTPERIFSLGEDDVLTHTRSCLESPGPDSGCVTVPVNHKFYRINQ